jgi:hypothetical protein
LSARLRAAGVRFVIEPHVRFKGEVGEQATMFFLDPSGNALEFKAFKDLKSLFAKYRAWAARGLRLRREDQSWPPACRRRTSRPGARRARHVHAASATC